MDASCLHVLVLAVSRWKVENCSPPVIFFAVLSSLALFAFLSLSLVSSFSLQGRQQSAI